MQPQLVDGDSHTLSFGASHDSSGAQATLPSAFEPSASPRAPLQEGQAVTLPHRAPWKNRLVKFSGIGPVDETGLPLASRSSVNRPRDWYRTMFRQIHQKSEELYQIRQDSREQTVSEDTADDGARSKQDFSSTVQRDVPGTRSNSESREVPEPRSLPGFTRGQGVATERQSQTQLPPDLILSKPKPSSAEVSLVSELSRYEAELDSEIRVLERRLSQKEQRQQWQQQQLGRGEGDRRTDAGETHSAGRSSKGGSPPPGVPEGLAAASKASPPVGQKTPERSGESPGSTVISAAPPTGTAREVEEGEKKEKEKMRAARAKFHFQAQSPKELTLQKGDVVYIHRQVDDNWFEGEHDGKAGRFPINYVEILSPSEKPTPVKVPAVQVLEYGEAVALYNFTGDLPVELPLQKGERVFVLRCVDKHWLEGQLPGTGRTGIFPISYAQVLKMPRTVSVGDGPRSHSPELLPALPNTELPCSPLPTHSPCPGSDPSPTSPLGHGGTAAAPPSLVQPYIEPALTCDALGHVADSSPSPAFHTIQTGVLTDHWGAGHHLMTKGGDFSGAPNPTAAGGALTTPAQSVFPSTAVPPAGHPKAPPTKQEATNQGLRMLQHQLYKSVYDYVPQSGNEPELWQGGLVHVVEKCENSWFVGTSDRTGLFGTFPPSPN